MSEPEGGSQPDGGFQLNVPERVRPGVYSNMVAVWHTPYEFTLDFTATEPTSPANPNVVPCQVVARVKIPPTVVFDLMRALNENMAKYEAKFGEIRRVEPRPPTPPDQPEQTS